MEREIRRFSSTVNSSEDRIIEGFAAVFEEPSVDMGFVEILKRGCITEETIKNSDVLCRFNHDDSKVLARCKNGEGSMALEVTERGLHYMFTAPNTALGDEVLEALSRGDVDSSSFAFTVGKEPGSEKWLKRDGKVVREIYKIDKIWDCAPVHTPAYPATTCSKRFAEIQETIQEVEGVMGTLRKEVEDL